jgi:hypothetical protein
MKRVTNKHKKDPQDQKDSHLPYSGFLVRKRVLMKKALGFATKKNRSFATSVGQFVYIVENTRFIVCLRWSRKNLNNHKNSITSQSTIPIGV